MFETVLASMGMGAAKIDLRLDKEIVTTGQEVTGQIVATGGNAEQKVEGLSVYFMLKSVHARSGSDLTERIAMIDVTHEEFVIQPNETITFPFSFTCPANIPASSINTKYYFITNLEIKNAIDSHDRDFIKVLPDERVEQFLTGFKQLGFKQTWEGLVTDDQGWSQLIQYHPTTYFYGVCSQIAVYYHHNLEQDTIDGVLEVGEHHGNNYSALIDMFHLDEKIRRFEITSEDLSTQEKAKARIERIVKQMLKK
ncbi:sporulation protein [Shimazuella sp. AN120528]|uniref:sporulation protein n=1 Tax=Shimazuella soli TaxID=1892854 RepID=UPI001F11768B|nr:sporulation protein [Shimazuella soli]MCH5585100.1 sporulation protein [Shimazuella soli]